MRSSRLVLILPLALAACGQPPKGESDAGTGSDAMTPDAGQAPDADPCPVRPCQETVADIPLDPQRDVDLLFVIDNSGSMAEEQSSLAANFNRFINVLENIEGGLPNVHLGIVSTDVGAGPYNISGCNGNGDNGTLQSAPRSACNPPTGAFIIDVDDGQGGRSRNYSDTLANTFSCIGRLGIDGCGFEQPLESMKRALDSSNPTNQGFLRQDALLAVVIVSDEDDCSASNTGLYDTSQTSLSDPLGPLSSFRCFEFGVMCDGDTPRTPGARTNCVPRASSPYMPDVSQYVDFLRSLKANPKDVMVAGIIGNPTPVAVGLNDMNNPDLQPSCISASGEADPGVRLDAFLKGFPQRNTETTICNDDLSDALVLVGQLVASQLGSYCLAGAVHDSDDQADGIQPTCTITEAGTELPACDNAAAPDSSTNKPCYSIAIAFDECDGTATNLQLAVHRDGPGPMSGQLVASCLVD